MKMQKQFNLEKERNKLKQRVLPKIQLIKTPKTQPQIIFQIKLTKSYKKYRKLMTLRV